MKILFFLLICSNTCQIYAQQVIKESESKNSIADISDELRKFIENPQIGARCQELIKNRKDKMALMHRATSLEEKTSKIMLTVPDKKKTIKEKLEHLKNEFFKEKSLLELKVKILEEEIIMKGCPGMKL